MELRPGLWDRVELSYVHHELEFSDGALDGLGVSDDVIGVKVKLFGDAVYNQDSWIPQVAVGAQYKDHGGIHDAAAVGLPGLTSPIQLGAEDDSGIDYYVSATKVFLSQSMLLNLTLRYTEAEPVRPARFRPATPSWCRRPRSPGCSAASSPSARSIATGRTTSTPTTRDAAWDVFVAWTPTHNVSLVAAYLNIGSVLAPVTGETADQDGAYLSLQVGF